MAQQVIQLDREKLSCSVCLDLLKDPVTIPCGHSYCMICIINCWDRENDKRAHSCPRCRQTFTSRPALVKNTMFAELVEELKKVNPQVASPHLSYAGPGDVACDFCTGKKLKALKSCLSCMASFCEQHLQPHYNVAPLKKHKLVEATFKLQENICSLHDEVMKIFCRTDQQSICYLCSMDDHKGHDTVSAAAERAERQTELGVSRKNIQQRIQERERDVKVIQQRVDAFNLSADEAVRDSEKIFTEMMSKVTQQIRSQQKTQAGKAKELEVKLQQEITDLRRKDTELEQLSLTEDHLLFLKNYPSLSEVSVSKDSQRMDDCPLSSFKDVAAAVSEVRDKLQAVLRRSVGLGGERGLSEKGSPLHSFDTGIISKAGDDELEVLPVFTAPIPISEVLGHRRLSRAERRRYISRTRFTFPVHDIVIIPMPRSAASDLLEEMAQQVIQLDQEKLSCSVCLDLLKDPVTIPCGHSYCMICINNCWDRENDKRAHSCPLCSQTFTLRPALVKNTMLAEFVEELKKVNPQPASPHLSYAGPGDVACDYCTGKKQRALKSCLVCMASFCEQHLQPHYNVALLKKHKLVEATFKLQENICSLHDEVMKIFCRTDQQSICYLCSMDEHKGHDTVSAAAERAERQIELGVSRKNIQQRVQERERDVKVIQQRVDAFNLSADEAVRGSEKILTEMIRLIEKRRSEVTQQIRSQQKTQAGKAKELEVKLQQEITDLRRKDTELEQHSRTEDHLLFLKNYPSLSEVSVSKDSQRMDDCPLSSFKDVAAAVSEVRDKLQAVLRRSVRLGGERGLSEKGSPLHSFDTGIISKAGDDELQVLPVSSEPKTSGKVFKHPRRIKGNRSRLLTLLEKQTTKPIILPRSAEFGPLE
uniref:uncharacterized protein n=1 Tax=Semicossyphus pulcher TaxID=241346 RepID=UPI0037E70B97